MTKRGIAGLGRRQRLDFQSPLHRGSLFNDTHVRSLAPKDILSVPSSSGKSLQRHTSHRITSCRHLSVPSSSGKSLQLIVVSSGRTILGTFSPLFIGEVSSTRITRAPSVRRSRTFSPLFIGEVSSTPGCRASSLPSITFQSPLHRGSLFNDTADGFRVVAVVLSVPSSSGKSLQRTGSAEGATPSALSVPSSSGKSLQLAVAVGADAEVLTFSPLFIGEVSSTWDRCGTPCKSGQLSVPSSSGKSLQQHLGTGSRV